MLGVDLERLSAADGLRVDMISALRLVIDHEQATVLDGGSADLGKLNVAVASLIALLPNRELPQPAVDDRDDPRQLLLDQYMAMRARGEISDEGKWVDEIAALKAEVAQLLAQLAGKAPEDSDVPTVVERVPVPAPAAKVVPLERRTPPPTSASAPPAPSYDYDRERGWRDYVQPDGSISPSPMSGGKYWGPV